MGRIHRPKTPCGKVGCKKFAMSDGSGLCQNHNPDMAENRRQAGLKSLETQRRTFTPDKKCVVEGCKCWRRQDGIYCNAHFRKINPVPPKNLCKKENCRRQFGIDTSGYCYPHSPLQVESRNRKLIKLDRMRKEAPPQARCRQEGCKRFPLRDKSGFCYAHNPALAQKRHEVAKLHIARTPLAKVPPQRACKVKGCSKWAKEDGSHLCFHHQPIFRLNLRYRLRVHHPNRGRHLPWLGLKDIKEARGLLWYSLETNQPLLTLRALTKIVSLHARGEVWFPGKFGIKRNDLPANSHDKFE